MKAFCLASEYVCVFTAKEKAVPAIFPTVQTVRKPFMAYLAARVVIFRPSKAPAVPTIFFTTSGFSFANSAKLVISGLTPAMVSFIAGSKAEPKLIATSFVLFFNVCSCPAVDCHLTPASFAIAPAYCVSSAQISKFLVTKSSCESKGEITFKLSLPKSVCIVESCSCLGNFFKEFNKDKTALGASSCIALASFTVSKPSFLKAILCCFVAALPEVMVKRKFFIPVAACSGGTFILTSVADNAVIGFTAIPA